MNFAGATHERKRRNGLYQYSTRPALSDGRVSLNAAGQVELKLKTPWRDGTTHLVKSPLEFMQRLAVPLKRAHPQLRSPRSEGPAAASRK